MEPEDIIIVKESCTFALTVNIYQKNENPILVLQDFACIRVKQITYI